MTTQPVHLTVNAIHKDGYWIALPTGVPDSPGGVSGDDLSELFEEVEACKHFILDLPKTAKIIVEYDYDVPGVSAEVLDSCHELRARPDDATSRLSDVARTAVASLRAAGLSVRDAAALLNVSISRVHQLSA